MELSPRGETFYCSCTMTSHANHHIKRVAKLKKISILQCKFTIAKILLLLCSRLFSRGPVLSPNCIMIGLRVYHVSFVQWAAAAQKSNSFENSLNKLVGIHSVRWHSRHPQLRWFLDNLRRFYVRFLVRLLKILTPSVLWLQQWVTFLRQLLW